MHIYNFSAKPIYYCIICIQSNGCLNCMANSTVPAALPLNYDSNCTVLGTFSFSYGTSRSVGYSRLALYRTSVVFMPLTSHRAGKYTNGSVSYVSYVLLVSHVKLAKKMKTLCLWTINFISTQTLRKSFENFDYEIFFDFFLIDYIIH